MEEKTKSLLIKFLISLVVIFPISLVTSVMLFGTVTSTVITTLTSFCLSLVLSVGHTFVPNDEEDIIPKTVKSKEEQVEEIKNVITENKLKQLDYIKESVIEQNEIIKIKIKQRENF